MTACTHPKKTNKQTKNQDKSKKNPEDFNLTLIRIITNNIQIPLQNIFLSEISLESL